MICSAYVAFMIYIIQTGNPYCSSNLFVYIASAVLNVMADSVGMTPITSYSVDNLSSALTTSIAALPSKPVLNCGYGIFADKEIILPTSTEPYSVVSNILVKLTEQRRRRRRRGDCPYDLPPVARFTMQSPTFYLDNTTFSRYGLSSWLVTKTCVYAGYSEVLEIWLRNKTDVRKIYGYKNITIRSRPTPPNFLPPGNNGTYDVSLCDLAENLTIVSAHKSGSCLSWSCSVRCMNCSELFWVVDGITVMASSKYIEIGQTYQLIVACNETASNSQGSIQESLETLMVRFSRNCLSALTQLLPSLRSTAMSTKSTTSITKPVTNQTVHTVSMYISAKTALSRKTSFAASVSAQTLPSFRSTTMSAKSSTSVTKNVSNQTVYTVSMYKSAKTALSRKTSFAASVSAQILHSLRSTTMSTKSTASITRQVSNSAVNTKIKRYTSGMYSSTMCERSRKRSPNAYSVFSTSPMTGIIETTASDISKPYRKIAVTWTVTERTQGYSGSPVVPKCDRNTYKGFIDDPRITAAVATTGGIILGIIMTVGYVIMSSRFKLCLCLPTMVSPVAEETQRRDDFQIDSTSNVSRTANE